MHVSFKRIAYALAFLFAVPVVAGATTPVQVFGTDSTGIQRVIGAVANVSGLYSLSVSTSGAAGALDVWSKGTTNASTQTSVTNSATQILAASTTRRGVTFVNHSTTIAFYLGPSGVTTSTGTLINPGATASFWMSAGAAWFGITASSTATVGALTESN